MTFRLPFLLLFVIVAGCGGPGAQPLWPSAGVRLTEAQACAVGYDLAREIHTRISLKRTVLVAPRRAAACERHALEYLRRAGFRIDRTGLGGTAFSVRVARIDRETVSAVAEIGGDLRIARAYLPVRSGVIAAGPVSAQRLSPDTYALREGFR